MNVKKYLSGLLAGAMLTVGVGAANVEAATKDSMRTVITNDGEVDDMNSVIRALLYSNEMDIAGIVLTSSIFHYSGDKKKGIEPLRWTGTKWIYKFIDDYGKVYPNLIKHDPNYPTAEYLRSVTHIGNTSNAGEMDEITDGSEFLKKLFLDDDPRTLYVQTWGGTNTTARALKSIEEEYKGTAQWNVIRQKLRDKLVLYIILDQDSSYADYIAKNWSDIRVINDRFSFGHFAYFWIEHEDGLVEKLKAKWNKENLLNKGALMDDYSLIDDGKWIEGEWDSEQRGVGYAKRNPVFEQYDFISEGDSPSFLYLVDNGLRNAEDPTYGGWGGRFGPYDDKSRAINNVMDYNPVMKRFEGSYSLTRWFDDIQNDFAMRADWCVADDYKKANHAPKVTVKEGLNITARRGEKVTLTAQGTDPDGDKLSYKWWRYFEADTYQDDKRKKPQDMDEVFHLYEFTITYDHRRDIKADEVLDSIKLTGANSPKVSFTVPMDAKVGDTIHMIIEVQDNGKHNLKHYQRVIVTVK